MEKCLGAPEAVGWPEYFQDLVTEPETSMPLQNQVIEMSEVVFSKARSHVEVADITFGGVSRSIVRSAEDFASLNRPECGTRIMTVFSNGSISPLQITSSLAERIFTAHRIRHEFLRVLLTFGRAPQLSEASHGCYAEMQQTGGVSKYMYNLTYVEPNKRTIRSPWSIRHVGIYHEQTNQSSLFVILHSSPHSMMCTRLSDTLAQQSATRRECAAGSWLLEQPQRLHSMVMSSYLDNWRPYLGDLGDQFSEINDLAMTMTVYESDGEDNESHVQSLRNLLDLAMFTSACCESTLHILEMVSQKQELSEDMQITRARKTTLMDVISSSKSLQSHIRNAIDMVSHTLALRNHLETVKLDREMKDMTRGMRNVAEKQALFTERLKDLTENTVDDSAIVRIITIVSAIYLPGSFVAAVFGMNFFDYSAAGSSIVISENFWIFIAAWAGFTAATGLLFYVTYRKANSHKRSLADTAQALV